MKKGEGRCAPSRGRAPPIGALAGIVTSYYMNPSVPKAEVSSLDSGSEPIVADLLGKQNRSIAPLDSERAQRLLHELSFKPAVLLARNWQVLTIPYEFEHIGLYQQVAEDSGCSLVKITRPDAGGLEHLLFMTRTGGLSDEEYLACVDRSNAPGPVEKIN